MDPQWKAQEDKPLTNEEAAAILRKFLSDPNSRQTTQGDVGKDLRNLSKALEAFCKSEKQDDK